METVTNILVVESDIDEFDHVNNGAYVSYLEKGRRHWYEEAGLSIVEMKERKVGAVLLKLDVLYKKELRLGDNLKVKTCPQRKGNKSLTFKQEIFNNKDELVTEAIVTCVMFDMEKRRSIKLLHDLAKHFK
ncbi:acyl-CoA thioesterase [Marinobacterium sp. MBR-109]|jgi:YbgC/YbaW family acyl-CoA thioester hydrolase|uniref:acyl-CoA thioesterase n=1 Tax=Marinobacterium sp. MBR-109 TaxID=3156462 RepID=UPI0033926494